MDELILAVGGQAFTGWIEASVSGGLDQVVDSFELAYADRWAEEGRPRQIQPFDTCVLYFGKHTLMTGYVDSITGDYGKDTLTLRTSGRSRTADLVDCSIRHATGHWRSRTLLQIVTDLTEPFGIPVEIDVNVYETNALKFERVEADDGEAVYDLISRVCSVRGVLAVCTPEGALRLTRIERSPALRNVILRVDETITRSWSWSVSDLFSDYYLRSQTGRRKNENGSRAALEAYSIKDETVPRYRPKVLTSEASARLAELKDHAAWERNTRHGKALRLTYQLPGAIAPDKQPWAPGMLVRVSDEQIGVNEVLVCARRELRVDGENLFTRIELVQIESYSTEPVPLKKLVKP